METLFAEFKGKNGFSFVYNGLLWFCMNKLPRFGGDNGKWVYDRIIQIECSNIISKEKQDKFLLDKMYAERNGIVRKAIDALNEVISNGYEFIEPCSVSLLRENYQADNSTVINFYKGCVAERHINNHFDECTTQKLYMVYKAWCADNNNGYAKAAKEFRRKFSEILGGTFEEVTVIRQGRRYYKSVTLSVEYKNIYKRLYGNDSVRNPCEDWNI